MAKAKKRNANGEGSVYKIKDGRYGTAVYLKDDRTGEKIRKVCTAKTEEEAKEKMRKFLVENGYIQEEESSQPQYHSEMTAEEFIIDTLDSLTTQVSSRTLNSYAYDISHFRAQFGQKKLGLITVKDIMQFLNTLTNQKNKNGEYKFSQSTLRAERRMIKVVFARAKSKGVITENPCLDYDFKPIKSKKITKEIKTFHDNEVGLLITQNA